MTQRKFKKRVATIMAQQVRFGVHIDIFNIIDKDHLNCTWYGGQVGCITMPDGWWISIEAHGEIRLEGEVKGHGYVDVTEKSNNGGVYDEIGRWCDDNKLHRLLNSGTDSDYLAFGNNNWFEANVISPDGEFFDMCFADNILDDNILACFEHVETLFGYVDAAKEQAKTA
jgi:hypothetical protein